MKFNIVNKEFRVALSELKSEFGFEMSSDGDKLEFIIRDGGISADFEDGIYKVFAPSKVKLFFGFFQLLKRLKKGKELDFHFEPFFEKNGIMIDNSRNGVANVSTVKGLLRLMAALGHSWYMLYMEDVYEIEDEPYFGYMRGRYSKAELKELDDYADMFGIELIPCIQTLAHVNQFFAWTHERKKYADIDDILNVSRDGTLKLIDKMFKNLSECFRTKTIHIGMDEAVNLGRGTYLDESGLKNKTQIMLEHLDNCLIIAKKYDLKPMIWDDMFFSKYSNIGGAKEFKVPDDIELMYWDYYHSSKDNYIDRITKRREIAKDVAFAGGAWRWTGYCPHHQKTLQTTIAGLSACRELDVKRVIATSWSDDGSEAPFYTTLFGMVLYSFLDVYEEYDEKIFSEYLLDYTGMTYDEWHIQCQFDLVGEKRDDASIDVTPSKYFFYQDLLMSQFVYYTRTMNDDYDKNLRKLEKQFANLTSGDVLINDFYRQYARCLILKWKLPMEIYDAYHDGDKDLIKNLVESKLQPLEKELDKFISLRRKIWLREASPQGLEVLEHRVGGMIQRLKSSRERLLEYVNGEIKIIEELEEKRIDPCPSAKKNNEQAVLYCRALKTMSVGRSDW